MNEINVVELSVLMKREDVYILDVRNPDEFSFSNIGGVNIPLPIFHERYKEVPSDKVIYCLCHHGVRSAMAQDFLLSKGYTHVINIRGGIDAWSLEVDSNTPRY